jgi:hypothetical protein
MNETNTTSEIPQVPTFFIPDWNIPVVQERIAKLNRRAERAGMTGIEMRELGFKMVNDPRYDEKKYERAGIEIPKIKMIEIEVEGEPKIEGWKFVGVLDLITIPNTVLVKAVPGESVPQQYFDHDGSCDHCNKIRRRNETFVVQNEDGTTQAVGRNCLRDFLGHSPYGLVGYLQLLHDLFADLDDDDYRMGGGGGYTPTNYELVRYLSIVACVIEVKGWVPRSAACPEEGRDATADIAFDVLVPPRNPTPQERRIYEEKVAKYRTSDKHKEEAKKAAEWMLEQNPDNEFIHNCQAIVRSETVNYKTCGFAAAVVSSYQRSQERLKLKEREFAALNNEYIGQVKDKIETEVTLKKVRGFDGQWNTVWMHEFRDNEGHVIIWMSNAGKLDYDIGEKFTIRGTIKQHKLYNDLKQTQLIRVKVVE